MMVQSGDDTKFSALVSLSQKDLKISSYTDGADMSRKISADLEERIGRQIQYEVVRQMAHSAGMDSQTFTDFLQFLYDDPGLRERFTSGRTRRKLTE